jgi:hypothetical protein
MTEKPMIRLEDGYYKCPYSSHKYKEKYNCQRHMATCQFLYTSNFERKDDFLLSKEKIPSQREMYLIIQELAVKCSNLEKEVVQLKRQVSVRDRKRVLEYLNEQRKDVVCDFTTWYMNMRIDERFLEVVFKEDLTEGIKAVLSEEIKRPKIPICAFSKKNNQFYIYVRCDDDSVEKKCWRMMHNDDLEKAIVFLSRQFLKTFMDYKEKEQWFSHSSSQSNAEENNSNENKISKMKKVVGMKVSLEKRTSDIKKWMFSLLEENMDSLDYS